VWLPAANYGLAAGFHDLINLDDSGSPGILRDINDNGVCVGQSGAGFFESSGDVACAWVLGNATADYRSLGGLGGGPSYNWSGAEAVNNEVPPRVVGRAAETTYGCTCPTTNGQAAKQMTWGFYGDLTVPQGPMSPLDPTFDFSVNMSYASGISDFDVNQDFAIAGASECVTPKFPCFGSSTPCEQPLAASRWINATGGVMPDLSANAGSYARGMSASGRVAGWAKEDQFSGCLRQAVYWSDPNAGLENLGDYMPSGQTGNACRAEDVNDQSPPAVVGMDTDTDDAMLWEKNGSGWDALNLNTPEAITDSDRWIIRQAHAINDSGWIAAFATDDDDSDPTRKHHAVLLVPYIDCYADLNGDGWVNVDDLLMVINGWGTCPTPPAGCPGDVNDDGNVNVDDLLAVINNWGICATPIQSGNMMMMQGSGSSPAQTLLEILQTIPNVPEEIVEAISAIVEDEQ